MNDPSTSERPGEPAPGFHVRALTAADWPAAKEVDAAAFGYTPDHDFLDTVSLPAQDISRFTGVFDPALDGLLVGIGAIQTRRLTLPGPTSAPVAAVTWVGVRPDQQRRGVLRALMTEQLHGLRRDGGEAVAILTASEGGIYGRFGYGLATTTARLELSTPAPLRPGTVTEPVREVNRDEAIPRLKEIHESVRSATPGYLDRPSAVWDMLLSEHPFVEKGRNTRRFALHRNGYAVFRVDESWTDRGPDHSLTISELSAETPVARASLWRHLLGYPLVRRVSFPKGWVDEPLQDLLANPRVLSADPGDHVWVRLVDLAAALSLRTYRSPASLVIRVSDVFCPWNDGTWQVELGADGGSAVATARPPDVEADIADLGAAFLGGTRIARLAAAGRVRGTADAIDRLDAALGTALRPFTPEGF